MISMSNLTSIESDHSDDEENNPKLCRICTSKPGKYTCPRCNIIYCSLPCYQSEAHSTCSEAFYRECVMDDMKCKDDDPDAERKMMEILHRIQQDDADAVLQLDSDDECEPDLSDRLSSVNLDDADSVWEKLTETERQEFEEFVRSGDVSKLLPQWSPWWKYKKDKKLVQELDEANQDFNVLNCPPVKSGIIPVLSTITKAPPADVVKYNVINVIGAYCHVTRWFNGDHQDFSSEAVQALTTLSGNLGLGHNYESHDLALEAVAQAAIIHSWLGGSIESSLTMKSDVSEILSGPDANNITRYLQAALSDIHALLSACKKARPTSAKDGGEFTRRFGVDLEVRVDMPATSKDKLLLYIKKVEYYLSWTKEYAYEICG